MTAQPILVYGSSWCPDCRRSLRILDQHNATYTYINIEEDEQAAAYIIQINKGNRSIPTIVFPDGVILVEPSNSVLQQKLTG